MRSNSVTAAKRFLVIREELMPLAVLARRAALPPAHERNFDSLYHELVTLLQYLASHPLKAADIREQLAVPAARRDAMARGLAVGQAVTSQRLEKVWILSERRGAEAILSMPGAMETMTVPIERIVRS